VDVFVVIEVVMKTSESLGDLDPVVACCQTFLAGVVEEIGHFED